MTPEQRLDRVERILGLFAREGRRWRVQKREQDEKINILIQAQMESTEKLNRTSENLDRLAESVDSSHAIHEKEMADLRESQKLTDKSLRAFIDSLRKGRNGSSSD
jgi:hypothetical protein